MAKMMLALMGISCVVGSLAAEDTSPLHAYLCAKVSEEAKAHNDQIAHLLGDQILFFKPQEVSQDPSIIYDKDLVGMEKADFLLLLPPYGRDCAFEVGWFVARGKPTILYTDKGGEWQNDLMLKGGLTRVITINKALYDNLLKDGELHGKVTLIPSETMLKNALISLVQKAKN